MIEQIPLEGFETPYLVSTHSQLSFRRASDRASDSHSRLAEVLLDCSPSLKQRQGTTSVTIFTLGRFSLLINGNPLDCGRKSPKRALDLLKVIIAKGGQELCVSRLAQQLWPDVDGDMALISFNTTLHRLRKIMRDERVLVLRDGKLSLNADCCWVDVWVFERLMGCVETVLKDVENADQIYMLENVTEHLYALYQGHFLSKDVPTGWSVSLHERLRCKFIHNLVIIGRHWEELGCWDRAIECYQKGIDVDNLVEVFYQRLMNCYLQANRFSEGLSIYRRCRQTLSIMLSLQPESQTESLYLALKDARSVKRSA